jgi:hypothetical protein
MKSFTKYILFVFTKNDNPGEFTEQIADELTVISDVPKISYYYGPESSVYTFSTLESPDDVKEYVDMILGVDNILYILLPYTSEQISFGLPEKVKKQLFNDGVDDYLSEKKIIKDLKDFEIRNIIRNQIKDEFFPDLSDFNFEFVEDDEDDDEIELIKLKSIKPTFDEVFDKIADMGINSLNEEEKLILNQYTK